jgi:DNA-binding NarL/FixJ family response regulator
MYELEGAETAAPAAEPVDPNRLTARQREIAALVARGLTTPQIAERLILGRRTVDTHVEHVLARLNLNSRKELAAWAARHGLLD